MAYNETCVVDCGDGTLANSYFSIDGREQVSASHKN